MTAPAIEAVALRRDPLGLLRTHVHRLGLTGILGLAALLNLWNLSRNGRANTYYAGAVRSMLTSWHNFFFVSFDSGGLVSVDKPPLALWLQAASAKLFGYSSLSILVPEALAGVAAVGLLYLLVARYFGRVAGLVAALALAVSPVSVAVNRDNNPDALFALLLVAAVYFGARAVESGRLRWLVGTAMMVGLAFNTKMLAALIVLPGLAAAYLFFAKRPWKIRFGHLAVAAIVLVVMSGAWIAAVDLTPATARPYVGSTSDNSALSLAFDYNGLGRITGQTGGTSIGGGLGGAFSGTPGVLRLINQALGDQGGWLLPLAILGGLSAILVAVVARRRRDLGVLVAIGGWFLAAAFVFSFASGIIHTYYLNALAPATSALVGIGVVALWHDARRGRGWLLLPLAALALTAWLEIDLLRRSDYLSWLQVLVIVGAAVAAAALLPLSRRTLWRPPTRAAVAAAAFVLATAGFLAAPTAWSATTWKQAINGVFPGAGPSFVFGLASNTGGFAGGRFGGGRPPTGFTPRAGGPPNGAFPGRGTVPRGFNPRTGGGRRGGGFIPPTGGGRPGGGLGFGGASDSSITAALAYAKAHGGTSRFTLIVSSEQSAAPYVVRGESVAAMGGFTGRETVLTPSYLAYLIRSGAARYFLVGGGGFGAFGGGTNAAEQTIQSTCRPVTAVSGLYDCAGSAAKISK